MEKRSATISARITPELEGVAQAIADAYDQSVSDLIFDLLVERAEKERRVFENLKRAFAVGEDLPGRRP